MYQRLRGVEVVVVAMLKRLGDARGHGASLAVDRTALPWLNTVHRAAAGNTRSLIDLNVGHGAQKEADRVQPDAVKSMQCLEAEIQAKMAKVQSAQPGPDRDDHARGLQEALGALLCKQLIVCQDAKKQLSGPARRSSTRQRITVRTSEHQDEEGGVELQPVAPPAQRRGSMVAFFRDSMGSMADLLDRTMAGAGSSAGKASHRRTHARTRAPF